MRRSDLLDRLGGARRVTYVCAPAGSGKTVLLRSWISGEGLEDCAAWVSVGRGERDPQRFWFSVLDALRATRAGAELVRVLTADPDLDGWNIVQRLLEDIGPLEERLVLVIDDVHHLESSDLLAQVELLLAQAPARLSVALLTRRDLPLGLHRLRLEETLTEIRIEDLRFTLEDARALFEVAGIDLSDAALGSLVEQTEGWAAGLRLAALSLVGHEDPDRFAAEFSGRDRTVAEYLMTEVLGRQSEEVTRLLLRTSVLEEVSGPLADRLCGAAGGERILMDLAHAGAFVLPVDDQQTWYRYHHLFADLLQLELRRTSPEEIPALHKAAAEWFSERGHPIEAVRHAQAAEDWELGARVLSDSMLGLYLDGLMATARELLSRFPRDMLTGDPELATVATGAELAGGSLAHAERYLARAIAGSAAVPSDRAERLRVTLALLRLSIAHRRNDPTAAEDAVQLLRATEADVPELVLGEELRAVALCNLAIAQIWTDRLEDAERHLEQALVLARRVGRPRVELMALAHYGLLAGFRSRSLAEERCGQAMDLARAHGWEDGPLAGIASTAIASWLARTGQVAQAEACAQHAERALRADVDPAAGLLLASARGMLTRLRGSYEEALEAFRTAERLQAMLVAPHIVASFTTASRLEVLIRLGEIDSVDQTLAELDDQARQRYEIASVLADLRLTQDDPDAALVVLAPLEYEWPMSVNERRWAISSLLHEARARDTLGDAGGSGRALERALDLAEIDGLVLPFLMSPQPDLLERYSRLRTAHASLIRDILGLLAGRDRNTRCAPLEPPEEPLSASELRVLRYLPTNLQAPEIASELLLSVNTVRTHIRHVYVKLGVHRRADAVDRARGLGLLSSLARR